MKSSEPPEEIKNLFHDYSQDDRMSADEMLRFVIQVQGETHADINYVKDIFHRLKHHGVFHPRGIHLEGFYRYLLSDFNSPLPVTSEVRFLEYNISLLLRESFVSLQDFGFRFGKI